jgi:hypothetical protein
MTTPLCFPPARAGTIVRIIGLLVFAALLQGCSAIKLAYNNASDFGYWWLDGYVDFSEAQTLRLRADMARLHHWHRTSELPKYAALLQKMELLAPANIGAEQVCALADEMRGQLDVLVAQIEPTVAALALTLTPAQLETMARKYAKTDDKYRDEWLSGTPEEQKRKRYKQVLERTEMIYGGLAAPQKDTIRQQVDLSSFDARLNYEERQRRQQDALQTLRRISTARPPLNEARELVHGYLMRTIDSPNPAYRAYQQSLLQEGCRSFAIAHNTTTPAQREVAVKRLRAYERDLLDLAAQQK